MSGKGATYANDLLQLIFQATPIANIADDAASSPLTNLYLSLHTADPGPSGNQSTSEVSYTSYARVAVSRDNTGFTISANAVHLAATATFPVSTGGGATAMFFAIGTAVSGAGKLLYSAPITSPIVITNGGPAAQLAGTTGGTES